MVNVLQDVDKVVIRIGCHAGGTSPVAVDDADMFGLQFGPEEQVVALTPENIVDRAMRR